MPRPENCGSEHHGQACCKAKGHRGAHARPSVTWIEWGMDQGVEKVLTLCDQAEANPEGWGGPMVVSFARSVRAALVPALDTPGEAQ